MLNVLAGDEDPDDGTFVVGQTSKSETKYFSSTLTKLYQTDQRVQLFDMPGISDTESEDLQHIKNMENHFKTSTGGKYSAVLLVLNSSQKKTKTIDNIVALLRCFFQDDRIIPVFNKCGTTKKSRDRAVKMAESYIEEWSKE